MKNNLKIFLTFSLILFSFLFINSFVLGADTPNLKNANEVLNNTATGGGYDPAKKDIDLIIGRVIKTFLNMFGIIFLILTIYGGFLWMTAGGSSDQVEKAKKFIINSIMGLIIVLFAYAIVFFVLDILLEASGYKG